MDETPPLSKAPRPSPQTGETETILRRSNVLHNIQRRHDTDEFAFTEEMAREATGYFFLSFGKVGAGKTTLHFHLLRYLEQHPDFDGEEYVDASLPDGQRAAQSQLINNWRNRWSEGTFPSATRRLDEVRALRYSLRPRIGAGHRINVTFLEVAGELLSEVITEEYDQRQQLPAALKALFDNPDVKLIIAFIVSPTALAQESDGKPPDTLYTAFLNYLRGNHVSEPDRRRTPILVVINNPDAGFQTVEDAMIDRQGANEWTPKIIERFMELFLPSFTQAYRRWPAQSKLITLFRLGKIKTHVEDGQEISVIANPPDYRHAARIVKFAYETFTGIKVRPPLWRRILRSLKVSS